MARQAASAGATAKSRSSKNPTSGNDTPNTADVSESDIARMKVGELRRRLRDQGVQGTEELKKPQLVKKLVESYVDGGAAGKSGSAKKAGSAKKSASGARNRTRGNDTADVSESEIARMKADELRRRLKDRGVKGTADLKKAELVRMLVKEYLSDATAGAKKSTAKAGAGRSGGAGKGTTLRTGKATSKSLKYSQEITSPEDEPERAGRSLATTDHEVIRRWAEARKAVPATVEGTGPGDTLGVLRFDFPGYGGEGLRHVEWEEWFATFDERRLNFIYQQTLSSGKRSNFFQLENPDREDA